MKLIPFLFLILMTSCSQNKEETAYNVIRVPEDAGTIQQAIDSAQAGDVVVIKKGTYYENLVIEEKDIILASGFFNSGDTNDIYATILNGSGKDAVLEIFNTTQNLKIIGLTIENADDGVMAKGKMDFQFNVVRNTSDGIDYEEGSGGLCMHNIFEQNRDDGIDLDEDVDIRISYNIIRNNKDDGIEIRLHPYSGNMMNYEISYNWIEGHGEDGIQIIDYPDTSDRQILIQNNFIVNTAMAGIGFMSGGNTKENYEAAQIPENIQIVNNTIVKCSYGITGGGNVLVLNNILHEVKNTALKGIKGKSVAGYQNVYNAGEASSECVIFENTLFTENPMFENNYTLSDESPLIDKGVLQFNYQTHAYQSTSQFAGASVDIGAAEAGYSEWVNSLGLRGDFEKYE